MRSHSGIVSASFLRLAFLCSQATLTSATTIKQSSSTRKQVSLLAQSLKNPSKTANLLEQNLEEWVSGSTTSTVSENSSAWLSSCSTVVASIVDAAEGDKSRVQEYFNNEVCELSTKSSEISTDNESEIQTEKSNSKRSSFHIANTNDIIPITSINAKNCHLFSDSLTSFLTEDSEINRDQLDFQVFCHKYLPLQEISKNINLREQQLINVKNQKIALQKQQEVENIQIQKEKKQENEINLRDDNVKKAWKNGIEKGKGNIFSRIARDGLYYGKKGAKRAEESAGVVGKRVFGGVRGSVGFFGAIYGKIMTLKNDSTVTVETNHVEPMPVTQPDAVSVVASNQSTNNKSPEPVVVPWPALKFTIGKK